MTDDGKVYRVNEDGSFTSIGNVEDLEKKPTTAPRDNMPPIPEPISKLSNETEVGWWKRNYNWLWIITLILLIGWFISCLSCAWPDYPQWDENGYISNYYTVDNTGSILLVSIIILVCYCLSRYLSTKDKTILKIVQILLIGGSAWGACIMFWLCEQEYSFLLVCLAIIPLSIWFVTICLSLFRRNCP